MNNSTGFAGAAIAAAGAAARAAAGAAAETAPGGTAGFDAGVSAGAAVAATGGTAGGTIGLAAGVSAGMAVPALAVIGSLTTVVCERNACATRVEEARREAHEAKKREWNELNRDYPIPDFLRDHVTGVIDDVKEDAVAVPFINIGITGSSGTGKSSLIRIILSYFGATPEKMPFISFESDGTTEPTPYVVPGLNERVRLWDLPGQGTERFPSGSYLRDMGLKYFDALLIVTDGRWKCDDSTLVDAIRFARIWFRVVRTKVDQVVESGQHDFGISQEEALDLARASLQGQLINVTNPGMIHLVTTRSHFWTAHGGAPFGLVSTLCGELVGFLANRANLRSNVPS